jgi:hypothetical protein
MFIQDDKKILFILEFRSIMQLSFVFKLLEQENEGNPDRSYKYYFFHMPFTILLHDFIFDSFVVTPVLTLPSPCNLLFVCNIHCTI